MKDRIEKLRELEEHIAPGDWEAIPDEKRAEDFMDT